MTQVWSDGQAGAGAAERDLDLGQYDPALAGVTVRARRLVQDTRQLQPGDAFVALGRPGAPALPWVQDALSRGAVAVLVDAAAGVTGERVHPVRDLAAVLGRIADDFTGRPSAGLDIVGITGTNGKTSISFLLTQAWARLGVPSATVGTLGAGITGEPRINMGMTTPQVTTLHQFLDDFRERGVRSVAMEVSSHALEQGRIAGVRFGVVAFTNLTRDHLDYHGTMEEYAAQKAKVFTLPGVHTAVINLDDEAGLGHFEALPAGVRGIGTSSQAHPDALVRAEDVQLTTSGLAFDLVIGDSRHAVASPLIGRFNVDNLLIAAAILHVQGVPAEQIAGLIPQLQPVLGRMTRIQHPGLPLVVVDAGHTPDAVRQSVTALRESGHQRLVVVFGATGSRDPGKRPEMAQIVEAAADLIIVTDDDVHHEDGDAIVADILAGMANPDAAVVLRDRREAIAYAIDHAGPGDVVLLQGKGHEPYQIIGDERVPFSDLDTAEELLRERATPAD